MPEGFAYDPDAFARVWRRLWELVPSYYRVLDDGDRLDLEKAVRDLVSGELVPDDPARVAQHHLARVLGALAAPLAAARQSIEELHRDLFIDSSSDAAIPLLAGMIGTTLVFPDAASNRRDVRGTVGWRRRKGTPAMLEDLTEQLSARMTPLSEGWQRLAMTQDINLLRLERQSIDLGDIRVAERTSGPLDGTFHFVDVRVPSLTTGRYHPKHLSHWLHVTQLFPAYHSEPAYIGDRGDPIAGTLLPATTLPALPRDDDWRYAVHPISDPGATADSARIGRYLPLRARRLASDDALKSDRIPSMHFAHAPGDYFGREGRFTIEILGIPAAVAASVRGGSDPVRSIADPALLAGDHEFAQLARPAHTGDDVELALVAVALDAAMIASGPPTVIATASVTSGVLGATAEAAAAPAATIAMLRIRPASGAAAFFAGGTFRVTAGLGASGDAGRWLPPDVTLAEDKAELRRRGQPRGAVALDVPATWVIGERWFYIGADGSLGEAQSAHQGAIDVALTSLRQIEVHRLVTAGIGAAWPPLPYSMEREGTSALVPTPGCGPVRIHGGPVLDTSGGLAEHPTIDARLVFAIATTETTTTYDPIGALTVGAPNPADRGRWEILDASATAVTSAAAVIARLRDLAMRVDSSRLGSQRLVVRFEAATSGAVLPPCEVAWRGASWHDRSDPALLVHLADLTASTAATADWPAPAGWQVSSYVSVARDGSTWDGDVVARASAGIVAPIGPADTGAVLLMRRQVRWRSLCPWQHEIAENRKLDPTPPGLLDVDVEHGLFAIAGAEPPPLARGPSPAATLCPNVTVEYQQGASAHVGALPADRSTELGHAPEKATRIVSRHGISGDAHLTDDLAIPRYATVGAALAAIDAEPSRNDLEVIEIADSATYPAEALVWPGTTGGGNPTTRLVIRASDGARPAIQVASWTAQAGAGLSTLVLRGLTLFSDAPLALAPPLVSGPDSARATATVEYSSLSAAVRLQIVAPAEGVDAVIRRSITSRLELSGDGVLHIVGSIVDDGDRTSDVIVASDGMVEVDRSTIMGKTTVDVLEASESIFLGIVEVADRFHGCIRFSRVELGSVLPRRHRVVPDLETVPPTPVDVRMVSLDRNDPAYARLAESCDARVLFGAADGSEMGAFHDEQWPVRREAVLRRLTEYTPAGLVTGLIRMD